MKIVNTFNKVVTVLNEHGHRTVWEPVDISDGFPDPRPGFVLLVPEEVADLLYGERTDMVFPVQYNEDGAITELGTYADRCGLCGDIRLTPDGWRGVNDFSESGDGPCGDLHFWISAEKGEDE